MSVMGSAFNLTCQNATYLFKPSKFNKYKSTKNIGFRYIIKVKAIYRQFLFFFFVLFCFFAICKNSSPEVFYKKAVLKILGNSKENTCNGAILLIKLPTLEIL